MKLSQRTIDRLAAEESKRFESALVAFIEAEFPEKTYDLAEGELREHIRALVGRARRYGIRLEPDLVAFVALSFELEEGFEDSDEHRWARMVLHHCELSGTEKVRVLERHYHEV